MNSALKCSVYAGLVAGTIDILAAAIINARSPLIILLAVASGLLGRPAFQGGPAVMVSGLLLQWAMSIVIAAIFTLAASKFPALARRWFFWGAAYGVVVFLVMNFVVVPLSAASQPKAFPVLWVAENLLAMLVFGWIVAFMANRFLTGAQPRVSRVVG